MSNELMIPEVLLIEKLQESDSSLSPALWHQMRSEAVLADEQARSDRSLPPALYKRKKLTLQDFVNKAISLPLDLPVETTPETKKQLYRLHLFCCQRAIHSKEVQKNPFALGFRALDEMKTALVGMLTSYRLIDPSCPYSWSREFFEKNVITDKGSDGHTIIRCLRFSPEILNKAVTEELVTDWLIYRAYDNNGIRTLMDYKNNLLTLPNYQRGGCPAAEFSRFERKMAEKRNLLQQKKEEALNLEYSKTIVHTVALATVQKMLAEGMSAEEMLAYAASADLSNLTRDVSVKNISSQTSTPVSHSEKTSLNEESHPWLASSTEYLPSPAKKSKKKPAPDTESIDSLIADFLEK